MSFNWNGQYTDAATGMTYADASPDPLMDGNNFTALEFNLPLSSPDTNDYLSYPASAAGHLGVDDFTISIKVKTSTPGADGGYYRRIYSTDGPSGNVAGNMQIMMDADTKCVLAFTEPGGLDRACTKDIADGEWHHVAVRRSGGTMSVWVDGIEEGCSQDRCTTTYTGEIGGANGNQPRAFFGRYMTSDLEGGFRGQMDDFEIRKTALTDGEIASLASRSLAGLLLL